MKKLTIALATFNEEENIGKCLESVKSISDEIIVVDGTSTDKTVEIAKSFGAKVFVTNNPPIFHINKQKALDYSTNEWILQLDADERVSPELLKEIKKVINLTGESLLDYQNNLQSRKLFARHQKLISDRDGSIGHDEGPFVAFFIPRLNYFMGKYLRYGGVYPDGVIRLFNKNSAFFPSVDVHEQIAVKGRVGWMENPLYHIDSPTFERYLSRNNRYTDLMAKEIGKNRNNIFMAINHLLFMPIRWFILTFIRHKGFLDGWQGFVFSLFSSLRFPISYIKYLRHK